MSVFIIKYHTFCTRELREIHNVRIEHHIIVRGVTAAGMYIKYEYLPILCGLRKLY